MTKQKIFVASLVVLGLLIANGVFLYGQYRGASIIAVITPSPVPFATLSPVATPAPAPTVGAPAATPAIITVNTATPVVATVQITDSTLLPGGVNLLRLLNTSGTQSTILGVMHDDGINGDAAPNDKILSLRLPFNEIQAGQIQLQVSAAFRGLLKRVTSTPFKITVWNSFVDQTQQIQFNFPSLPSSVSIATSPESIDALIERADGSYSPIFSITIIANPSRLPLQTWFSQARDPDHILESASTMSFTTLSSGSQALLLSSAIPTDYVGGPLPSAYVMSKDGARIASVMEAQENALYSYGYTAEQIAEILQIVAQTMDF